MSLTANPDTVLPTSGRLEIALARESPPVWRILPKQSKGAFLPSPGFQAYAESLAGGFDFPLWNCREI
jgi:hypothetical protein